MRGDNSTNSTDTGLGSDPVVVSVGTKLTSVTACPLDMTIDELWHLERLQVCACCSPLQLLAQLLLGLRVWGIHRFGFACQIWTHYGHQSTCTPLTINHQLAVNRDIYFCIQRAPMPSACTCRPAAAPRLSITNHQLTFSSSSTPSATSRRFFIPAALCLATGS